MKLKHNFSLEESCDITLQTKVHVFKAVIFPVVMFGCERWTHKEGQAAKNWCFQIMVLENTLESLLDWKEIQSINPKGN